MWWNYIDTEAKQNYEKTTTFSTKFYRKNITCKTENFYNLLAFSLRIIDRGSIYCYLTKYVAKQKHLLPFQDTSSKLNGYFG